MSTHATMSLEEAQQAVRAFGQLIGKWKDEYRDSIEQAATYMRLFFAKSKLTVDSATLLQQSSEKLMKALDDIERIGKTVQNDPGVLSPDDATLLKQRFQDVRTTLGVFKCFARMMDDTSNAEAGVEQMLLDESIDHWRQILDHREQKNLERALDVLTGGSSQLGTLG